MTIWKRVWGLTYGEAMWLTAGIVLLVYELWAVAFGPKEGADVLTRAYKSNSFRWWLWPAGLGVLMGHLNGPVWSGAIGKYSPAVFAGFLAVILLRDLFWKVETNYTGPFGLFIFGFALGCLFWPGGVGK